MRAMNAHVLRAAVFACGALLAGPAAAQELVIPPAVYPTLAVTASSAAGFAPNGWVVEAQAEGELNADGQADLVFVLHETNPANILNNAGGLGVSELDSNPRMLAVALRKGQSYELALENHALISRNDTPTIEDPFNKEDGLTVARGAFSVMLHLFANAGGWDAGTIKFTFRYQDGNFELIGWDNNMVARNSGVVTIESANFSTGVLEVRTGSIENDKETVKKKKLRVGVMPIDKVGDGMMFGSGAEGSPVID
jgi:hypothetical protein